MRVIVAIFAALLLGTPLWLVPRAWRSYHRLGVSSSGELLRMRAGLALISVSAASWIAVFSLTVLEDYSVAARSLAQNLSPVVLGLINILLCVAAFGCSEAWRSSAHENGAVRRAIGIGSAALTLVWLFILANPH